jgi:acyl-CoA reductase-like NAD-dependent aldehyde dehydrogenase
VTSGYPDSESIWRLRLNNTSTVKNGVMTCCARNDEPRHYDKIFVGGRWVDIADGKSIDIFDSYSEAPISVVHSASAEHIDLAVTAARAALRGWSATSVTQRAALLERVGEGLTSRAESLALDVTRETGMPLKLSSRIQIQAPAMAWLTYANLIREFEFESTVGQSLIAKVPIGVVACITPWNYPLHQITAKVAAALAAGCTVVLKPSELAPSSALALAEIIEAAGFPPGVFNLVFGDGATSGEALVSHPGVDMISFTGSTSIGKHIGEIAARDVKRVSLELGGKSASIVLDDADMASAAKQAFASCCLNSGQTCSAITRLIIPRGKLDLVSQWLIEGAKGLTMGDPQDKATRLGPLVSALQKQRVEDCIKHAIDEGAQCIVGPADAPVIPRTGYFVAPTVLLGKPADRLAQEEIFGPVLTVLLYDTEEDAIGIANGTRYGLAGAVWSASRERAMAVARQLRAGQIDINGAPFNPLAPFGGFGQSGIGRENGVYGIEEFLLPRAIQLPA